MRRRRLSDSCFLLSHYCHYCRPRLPSYPSSASFVCLFQVRDVAHHGVGTIGRFTHVSIVGFSSDHQGAFSIQWRGFSRPVHVFHLGVIFFFFFFFYDVYLLHARDACPTDVVVVMSRLSGTFHVLPRVRVLVRCKSFRSLMQAMSPSLRWLVFSFFPSTAWCAFYAWWRWHESGGARRVTWMVRLFVCVSVCGCRCGIRSRVESHPRSFSPRSHRPIERKGKERKGCHGPSKVDPLVGEERSQGSGGRNEIHHHPERKEDRRGRFIPSLHGKEGMEHRKEWSRSNRDGKWRRTPNSTAPHPTQEISSKNNAFQSIQNTRRNGSMAGRMGRVTQRMNCSPNVSHLLRTNIRTGSTVDVGANNRPRPRVPTKAVHLGENPRQPRTKTSSVPLEATLVVE